MNGRAYDYNLGRFLSVDPFIQEPGNSQSMNPYSYIMNNPLAGTDPTGYRSRGLGSGWQTVYQYDPGQTLVAELDNGVKIRVDLRLMDNKEISNLMSNINLQDVNNIDLYNNRDITAGNVGFAMSGGTNRKESSDSSFKMAYLGPGTVFDLYNVIKTMTDIDAGKIKKEIDDAYIQGRDEGDQDFTKWSNFWAHISTKGFMDKDSFESLISRQLVHQRECGCKDVQPHNRDIADHYHYLAINYYNKLFQLQVAKRIPSELKGIMIDTYAVGFVQSRVIDIVGTLGRKSDVEKAFLDMHIELMRSIHNQGERKLKRETPRYY